MNVIKMQPDYATAHVYLGYTYAMKGQYAEAIAAYQKSISLDGETTSTLCYLGYAYVKSGQRDEALAILNKLKTTKESCLTRRVSHPLRRTGRQRSRP